MKREGERQCSVREEMERELQGLKQQNLNLHVVLSHRNSASGNEVRREFNTERDLLPLLSCTFAVMWTQHD